MYERTREAIHVAIEGFDLDDRCPRAPGLRRDDNRRCVGSDQTPDASLATVFEGCAFEDRSWTNGEVFRLNDLYTVANGAEGATWRNCTFTAHRVRTVTMGDDSDREIFEGCTLEHGDSTRADNAPQASFRGSRITSCHFTESPEIAGGGRDYYVGATNVMVGIPASGARPTVVDGPHVHWGNPTGPIGVISP